MKTEILIVTHQKDYGWLWYALHSLVRHTRGFSGITVCYPHNQWEGIKRFITLPIQRQVAFTPFEEWPGKGMLSHDDRVLHGDEICPHADFIMNWDSDWVMNEDTDVDYYFSKGRPDILYRRWENIPARDRLTWKPPTDFVLGKESEIYTMARPPFIYGRDLYEKCRHHVEGVVEMDFAKWLRSLDNKFPTFFCEYATLGAYAYHFDRENYNFIDTTPGGTTISTRREHHVQFWSHAGIRGKSDHIATAFDLPPCPEELMALDRDRTYHKGA